MPTPMMATRTAPKRALRAECRRPATRRRKSGTSARPRRAAVSCSPVTGDGRPPARRSVDARHRPGDLAEPLDERVGEPDASAKPEGGEDGHVAALEGAPESGIMKLANLQPCSNDSRTTAVRSDYGEPQEDQFDLLSRLLTPYSASWPMWRRRSSAGGGRYRVARSGQSTATTSRATRRARSVSRVRPASLRAEAPAIVIALPRAHGVPRLPAVRR